MAQMAAEGFVTLLTALGAGVLLWLLWGRVFCRGCHGAVVLKVQGAGCGLEQQIHGLLWLRQSGLWSGNLLLLDCGLGEEGQQIVRRLAGDHGWVTLCTRSELLSYLEK